MEVTANDILFNKPAQEAGRFYGYNDLLTPDYTDGSHVTYEYNSYAPLLPFFFEGKKEENYIVPALYVHITRTFWSYLTGLLREYFLPWRWQVINQQLENGSIQRILISKQTHKIKITPIDGAHHQLILSKLALGLNNLQAFADAGGLQ